MRESVPDGEVVLDDLSPARRGQWVVGHLRSRTLGISPVRIEGEIRGIYRELAGRFPGRIVLEVGDSARLALPEDCQEATDG